MHAPKTGAFVATNLIGSGGAAFDHMEMMPAMKGETCPLVYSNMKGGETGAMTLYTSFYQINKDVADANAFNAGVKAAVDARKTDGEKWNIDIAAYHALDAAGKKAGTYPTRPAETSATQYMYKGPKCTGVASSLAATSPTVWGAATLPAMTAVCKTPST